MTVPTARVKVFGERNTGTRAVLRMLRRSENVSDYLHPEEKEPVLEAYNAQIAALEGQFKGMWRRIYREAMRDSRQAALGTLGTWKHAAPNYHPTYRQEAVQVLFMTRNPYSWLLALHRRPYHGLDRRDAPFSDFISRPWLTVRRDGTSPVLASPMALWNAKLAAYRTFRKDALDDEMITGLLSFEDFVHAPAHALKKSLRDMGLDPQGLHTGRATKPMGLKARARRHYYARELWRDALSEADVATVNEGIDWALAERFGYRKIDATAFPATAKAPGLPPEAAAA